MRRSFRRHRNPPTHESREHPFFSKTLDTPVQTKEEHAPFFQTKGLTVGQPGDKYEQEADAMADAVVNSSSSTPAIHKKEISSIQRESLNTPMEKEKPEVQAMGEKEEEKMPVQKQEKEEEEIPVQKQEEEKPALQTKPGTGSNATQASLTHQIDGSVGKGTPLPHKVRAEMKSAFGKDFSGVHIHTNNDAVNMNKSLHAQAFTHGKDIYFNTGKYNPDTDAGKQLLAHELTHVVQQNHLQPKEDPLIVARQREGGETSQQGLNEQEVGCPEPSRLEEIEQNYRSMIQSARERGANVAADNLEYFLSGAGGTRTLGVNWLRGFSAITSAERRNQQRFENSLKDIADTMNHGDRRTFNDFWDAQLTADITTELYYASGTSTIRSTGNFSLERIEDIVNIHGRVEHRWHDPYDWHAGLSAYIPGHGNISDNDGLIMQSCRGARPFQMEANWIQTLSGTVTIKDYWFNSSSLTWTGP